MLDLVAETNLLLSFVIFFGSRVSIVDKRGNTLLDTLVRPTAPIVNFRTASTGLDASSFGCELQKRSLIVVECCLLTVLLLSLSGCFLFHCAGNRRKTSRRQNRRGSCHMGGLTGALYLPCWMHTCTHLIAVLH